MKIQKPAEEIEVCDICRRGGYLQACIVCGVQYCLIHKAIIPGCWHQPNVCQYCGERDDVRLIVARYSDRLTPIFKARDAALVAKGADLFSVEALQEETT